MRVHLTPSEKLDLVRASTLSPCPTLRLRCRWLLWLDRGCPVAVLARASKVSRPTVYQALRSWAWRRSVQDLRPGALAWRRGLPRITIDSVGPG